MANLKIEIQGLKELQDAFRKAPEVTLRATEKALQKTLFQLLRSAREHFHYFPVTVSKNPPRTGFLMGPGMVTSFGKLSGRLENVAPYASYVHDGTYKMMERPFFEEAIESSERDIDGYFETALSEIITALSR